MTSAADANLSVRSCPPVSDKVFLVQRSGTTGLSDLGAKFPL